MKNLNYGIIGNCRSAALISESGSMDWCCLPKFDSSSIFAKLLDEKIGGSFEIITDETYTTRQYYIENTAILVTVFSNGTDAFEVNDFMPRYLKEDGSYNTPPEIIRYIKKISGNPVCSFKYDPKLEYAAGETHTYVKDDYIVSLTENEKFNSIFLHTNFDKEMVATGAPIAINGDSFFLLAYNEKIFSQTVHKIYLEFERTKTYWLNWT